MAADGSLPVPTARRFVPEPILQERLGRRIAATFPLLANQAPRVASDLARDLAMPIATVMEVAWRGILDHALFDSELEGVPLGRDEASTALLGDVLEYAAAVLQGRAPALEVARAHLKTVRAAR